MGNASTLAGFLLLIGAVSAPAADAHGPHSVDGAFARLSPGNQKVARALFDAQTLLPTPAGARGSRGSSMAAARPLTLNEIAARKQHGSQDWTQVFQSMKAQGLVQERSLRHVVARWEEQRIAAAASLVTNK
jgi:hypothetical protein